MIDVEVARTFLAVAETGKFQDAAKRVNVTQSTVSARIKTLEDRLGEKVFDRSKTGARLTSQGRNFERYARTIVQAWEQGRRNVALARSFSASIGIGGQSDLWTRFLSQWLIELEVSLPKVAVRGEVADPSSLMTLLSEGHFDIVVMHDAPGRPGIEVAQLMTDEMALVTTDPAGGYQDRYVFLDWGERFRDFHAQAFPSLGESRTSLSLGYFGVRYILAAQGAGYAPLRLVQPHIDSGYLFRADDAPTLRYPVFVGTREGDKQPALQKALSVLKDLAAVSERGGLPPPFWSKSD